ncbi:MAG TPA: NADH:flavin oxidoreductase/NADH oxidase [Candidatus Sulfotelmatobacter sp.]|nr:NADH:flavin oxidoreductase/NADH oxidase [Candidatus Sulfotelmatobacter sp.]
MHLFEKLEIRGATLRNRIAVSPMCQYSSTDGFANDWHLVHLGSRAVGGAAVVFTEASAVLAEGRISPQDLGIYKNEHMEMLARIAHFIRGQGAIPGIQLAHAGRKGSTFRPWEGARAVPVSEGGWIPVAPSAISFSDSYALPVALDTNGIRFAVQAFADAARRTCEAGFGIIEIHAAHGYLIHEFLSPLSNQRTDAYGGSFENRTRLLREVVGAVRKAWPDENPLFVRISATDWIEGGWDLGQSIELARQLGPLGVDLIDCSSGGILPGAKIPIEPGYQVPFAAEIRRGTGILTGAVGLITSAAQADAILREEKADVVLLAREFLRQPYWPLRVAHELGFPVSWPAQYLRAAPDGTPAREAVAAPDLKRCMSEQHAIPES